MQDLGENVLADEETAMAEAWWHVGDLSETSEMSGGAMLLNRCIQAHKWDEAYAHSVLLAYRQYLELKAVFADWQGLILFPTQPVAQMWHQHMQDAKTYNYDCKLLCGRVIGYHIDKASDTASKKKRVETTKIAVWARFGSEADAGIWSLPKNPQPTQLQDSSTTTQSERGGATPAGPSKMMTKQIVTPEAALTTDQKENVFQETFMEGEGDNDESEESQPPETLKLRIMGCGTELHILVLSNEPLGRAFESFAEHKELDERSLRFYASGRRVFADQTPEMLDLHDCDIVNVIRFSYHRSEF